MKKALFISHSAKRTGAPILLANLALAIQKSHDIEINFLLLEDGKLKATFESIGTTHLFWESSNSDEPNPLIKESNINSYDFIIANTVISSYIISIVRKHFSGIIFTFIHELHSVFKCYSSDSLLQIMKDCTTMFLAPCNAVKKFLIEMNIEKESINILPYYIPAFKSFKKAKRNKNEFIIGGCGTIDIRKGIDLFIQIAYLFYEKYPNSSVKFLWKGGNHLSVEAQLLKKDITSKGFSKIISFEKESDDMGDFYSKIDVFLLTSREDPYPLVMLEAANCEVPSICFADAGGSEEFIRGNGIVVDYLDLDAVVTAINQYYFSPDKRMKDGYNSAKKLASEHEDSIKISNQLLTFVSMLQ